MFAVKDLNLQHNVGDEEKVYIIDTSLPNSLVFACKVRAYLLGAAL
jgi:hypothetical protein